MFFLERLTLQGTEKCPQYLWKQWAYCMKRAPLEKFLSKQARPEVWRIEPPAAEVEKLRAAKKAC